MDIVLKNKYKIALTATECTLKESIDSIAYTLNLNLTKGTGLVKIGLAKYDSIKLYDYTFLTHEYKKIFDGFVWDMDSDDKERTINLVVRERTVNMEESEDEYSFAEGSTATQRATQICNDWGIPIGNLLDTKIGLAQFRNSTSLFSIMWNDLKETAQKGGKLYKYRMEDKLNLIELGTNITIYKLDSILNSSSRKSSMQGAITQVKVLGENKNVSVATGEKTKTGKDKKKSVKNYDVSPTIGVFKSKTEEYGTLQKILQDSNITDYKAAQKKAESMFYNGDEIWTFKCEKDISDIRAGDKVSVYSKYYYVSEITHDIGNNALTITAMENLDDVKGKFYGQ